MSFDSSSDVTLTIDNNIWYVSKYQPTTISYIEEDDGGIEPIFPWELKFKRGHFKTIGAALGLDVYFDEDIQYGKIDPEDLIYFLDTFIPELALKQETVYVYPNGEEVREEAIDRKYVSEVVSELYKISKEANRRKAMILWD